MGALSRSVYFRCSYGCRYFSSLLHCSLIWRYRVCALDQLSCFVIHKNEWVEQVRIKWETDFLQCSLQLSWADHHQADEMWIPLCLCTIFATGTGGSSKHPVAHLWYSTTCRTVESPSKQILLAPEQPTEKNTPSTFQHLHWWGSHHSPWQSSIQLLTN